MTSTLCKLNTYRNLYDCLFMPPVYNIQDVGGGLCTSILHTNWFLFIFSNFHNSFQEYTGNKGVDTLGRCEGIS